MIRSRTLGAIPQDGGRCLFRVRAPLHEHVEVHVTAPHRSLLMLFNFSESGSSRDRGEGWAAVLSSSNAAARAGKAVLSARSLVVYERKVVR